VVAPKYQTAPSVVALAKRADSALTSARDARHSLADPWRAAKEGLSVLGGSAVAGVLDAKAPRIPMGQASVAPSLVVGLVAIGAGIGAGYPMAVDVGIGMVAPHVYIGVGTAASSMGTSKPE